MSDDKARDEPAQVVDLMAALEASLSAVKDADANTEGQKESKESARRYAVAQAIKLDAHGRYGGHWNSYRIGNWLYLAEALALIATGVGLWFYFSESNYAQVHHNDLARQLRWVGVGLAAAGAGLWLGLFALSRLVGTHD
jgi:hypothetical protein